MSRSRLDSVSRVIIGIVESEAAFVFLHSVVERSVGLTVVCEEAVQARYLVDGVRGEIRRGSSLRLCASL